MLSFWAWGRQPIACMSVPSVLGLLRALSCSKTVSEAFPRAWQLTCPALLQLALLQHPDVQVGDATAADQFRRTVVAYQVLSDPNAREYYDLSRRDTAPWFVRTAAKTMAFRCDSGLELLGKANCQRTIARREYACVPSDRMSNTKRLSCCQAVSDREPGVLMLARCAGVPGLIPRHTRLCYHPVHLGACQAVRCSDPDTKNSVMS